LLQWWKVLYYYHLPNSVDEKVFANTPNINYVRQKDFFPFHLHNMFQSWTGSSSGAFVLGTQLAKYVYLQRIKVLNLTIL
jgi:hypothetical protein